MLYYEDKAKSKGFKTVAGVDEAGCGPWAGPVVAAAVILKKTDFKNKIDDSKKLSPKQRKEAYEEIIDNAYVGVGIIDSSVIDSLNILEARRIVMVNAILNLKKKPDFILVDGDIKLDTAIGFENIIKGDSKSKSIAGASIIAKVTRDRIMEIYDKAYPGYEFLKHKGYGTSLHTKMLHKLGPSPIHRISYKPVKCLLKKT